jgi:predicted PurR-regulated permease PerM
LPAVPETGSELSAAGSPRRGSIPAIYRPVLLAAGLLVLGLLFRELVTLLLAVLITVILAIPLAATATFLQRYRVPRPIGALVGLLGGTIAIAATLALVIPPLVGQVQSFVDQVPETVDSVSGAFADATGSGQSELGDSIQSWAQGYVDQPERLIGPATTLGLGVAGVLGALFLIVITAFYMAVRPDPLVSGALRLVPPPRRDRAYAAMLRLRAAWIGWMKGVAVDMAVTGVLLYAALTLIGLDFALLFAVISALLVVIPYFGSIVGAIPPVLFALADSPTKALLALGVYVLVQQIESNVVIPLVMARTTKLHPALVAIGVVVVGELFGFLGLFVAVPILSTIVILTHEAWVRPIEESSRAGRRAGGLAESGYEPPARRASSTSERTPKPDAPLPT